MEALGPAGTFAEGKAVELVVTQIGGVEWAVDAQTIVLGAETCAVEQRLGELFQSAVDLATLTMWPGAGGWARSIDQRVDGRGNGNGTQGIEVHFFDLLFLVEPCQVERNRFFVQTVEGCKIDIMIEGMVVVAGVGVEDVVADAEVAAVGHDDVAMQCVGGIVYGGLESCQVEMSAAFEAQYIERAAVDEHIAFEQGVMIMLGLEAD